MASIENITNCTKALQRVQTFDPETLSRVTDLGLQMNFEDAVNHAQTLIDLYKRLPISVLPDFTDQQLSQILAEVNADFNVFDQILNFDSTGNNSVATRAAILTNIKGRRDAVFIKVWQYIAYGVARMTDTELLETQSRSAIQKFKDNAEKIIEELNRNKLDSDQVLDAIKAVASEQGVSQQAIYFGKEVTTQEESAKNWLTYTFYAAISVVIFAVLSLALHKVDWIRPSNSLEMFQLISSKILIFSVLGYMLILAAKNYATHKHNAVVNKHRQNALLTYRSPVAAAGDMGTQDIVLAHAASCIFSPQDTGFANGRNDAGSSSKSVLELFTKGVAKSGE